MVARPVRVSLATGRDGRVVATLATRGEKGAESVDEIRTSGFATDDGRRAKPRDSPGDRRRMRFRGPRARLDEGLASLRAARLAARDAGSNPTRMLEADADAAAAVANLEAAAEAFDRLADDANDAGPNDAGPNEKDFRTIFAGAGAAAATWATPWLGQTAGAALLYGGQSNAARHWRASRRRRGRHRVPRRVAEECLVLAAARSKGARVARSFQKIWRFGFGFGFGTRLEKCRKEKRGRRALPDRARRWRSAATRR